MKNIIFLSLLGLLAIFLYLSFRAEHRQSFKEGQAYQRLQVAEFDRDFNRAWNGKEKPEDHQRVAEAEQNLKGIQSEMVRQEGKSREAEEKLGEDLQKFLNGERSKK